MAELPALKTRVYKKKPIATQITTDGNISDSSSVSFLCLYTNIPHEKRTYKQTRKRISNDETKGSENKKQNEITQMVVENTSSSLVTGNIDQSQGVPLTFTTTTQHSQELSNHNIHKNSL